MIRSLRLVDFRCFPSLNLDLAGESALFVGENAQGKTSLLESVCLLVRLQSPRTHRHRQLVRFEQRGFGVAGECWGEERRVSRAAEGLEMRVNGEEIESQTEYLASGGLLVWMGNEDLGLIRGPGEGRRRFLDFVASQWEPAYRRELSRYRRALKARNLLLKQRLPDSQQIEAYTKLLVLHGHALQQTRARLVDLLAAPVDEAQAAISTARERVSLEYRPAGGMDLATAFEQVREREHRQGSTLVGPHRDDLVLKLNELPASDFGSEGQQRTLALALKLAQGRLLRSERGRSPVYLIDDIFGELDPQRRNALMSYLPGEAQKLITTTSLAWLDSPDPPPLFEVASGKVNRS